VLLADFAILVSMATVETGVLCHDDFLCSMAEGTGTICLGIDFNPLSSVTKLPPHAARSMI
jgi:hypothetical protein